MEFGIALILLYVMRSVIGSILILWVVKYMDSHPPRNRTSYRIWKYDEKNRKWCMKYYWLIGLLFFLAQVIVAYLWMAI